MSGRDWGKNRQRQLVRDRGVDDIKDQSARLPRPRLEIRLGYGSIEAAATWLTANRARLRAEGKHTVPVLRDEFGLGAKDAIAAIRRSNEMGAAR